MSSPAVAVVCIGMAGSGKTTFMQRINSYLHSKLEPPYVMNLDPAVRTVPFDCNIDIRESIDYKEVMKQYNLGPNGGILTSLNLFATKVDQVIDILEKRCGVTPPEPQQSTTNLPGPPPPKPIHNILIDTPGQIEVFVWSASGQILLSSLASSFPTVLAYVIDTPRTASTSTFMSNMLYACSILYKTKLPMILVFNKTDVQSADFAKEWMTDFEAFQAALKREEETGIFGGAEGGVSGPAVGGSGYMSSLLNSMSLVLEEFYRHLSVVGVSAMTGQGIPAFFDAVKEKAEEFERDYRPELERRKAEKNKEREQNKDKELGRLMKDLNVEAEERRSNPTKQRGSIGRRPREEPETVSEAEDADDDDEDEMDDQPEADFIEPDEEGSDQDEEGMTDRYQRALAEENEKGMPSGDDFSFARYIRNSNIGG